MLVDVVGQERPADPEVPLHEQELGPGLAPVRGPFMAGRSLVHLVDDDGRDPPAEDRARDAAKQLGETGDRAEARGSGDGSRQSPLPRERDIRIDVPLRPVLDSLLDQVGEGVGLPGALPGHEDGRLAGVEAEIAGPLADQRFLLARCAVVFLGQGAQPRPVASSSSLGTLLAHSPVDTVLEDLAGQGLRPVGHHSPSCSRSER